MGRSAVRTTCQAVARSGMRDHGRNSEVHEQAVLRRPVAQRRRRPPPPRRGTTVRRRCRPRSASAPRPRRHGEQLRLGVSVKICSWSSSGGMWTSAAPGSHHQAGSSSPTDRPWSASSEADVPVAQALVAGHLVVAAPERNAREAARPPPPPPAPERRCRSGSVPEHSTVSPAPRVIGRSGAPRASPGGAGHLRTSASGHYRSLRVRERYRSQRPEPA